MIDQDNNYINSNVIPNPSGAATDTLHKAEINGTIYEVESYKTNPVMTGSVSVNRKASTPVGSESATFGEDCIASGNYSFASGRETIASGNGSHAVGEITQASGLYAWSAGTGTIASGNYSNAWGQDSKALGNVSHAEGDTCQSIGVASHAEGYHTLATQQAAHAEGSNTGAHGTNSHAEGYSTTAGDYASHAEGHTTVAGAAQAHAEGYGTKAMSVNQHVQGKYNILDPNNTYADIVGNGYDDSDRSNAYTLDWYGNGVYAGNVTATDIISSTNWDGTNTSLKDTITALISRIAALES